MQKQFQFFLVGANLIIGYLEMISNFKNKKRKMIGYKYQKPFWIIHHSSSSFIGTTGKRRSNTNNYLERLTLSV